MTAFATSADQTSIAYEVAGEGEPIVLIHGFGASRTITWKNTGWYQTIARAGRRLIAVDCRGHGESGKPHDMAAYDEGLMAADIVAVLDALAISRADIMGYSMGGFLSIRIMHDWPERVGRAVLAGIGATYFNYWPQRMEVIAEGLLAPDKTTIVDQEARTFRDFGERAGNDLVALAACIRRPRRVFMPADLEAMRQPVLVVCGELDEVSGPGEPLAKPFPNGRAVVVPKRNHHSTVGDRIYKDAVVDFLSR